MMRNSVLKSPIYIGSLKAPNRIVHQSMECNDSFGGFPSELTIRRYRRLADAKAGITVVEAAAVMSSSLSRIHQLIIDEQHREGINRLTNEFKRINSDTLLCYQLNHPGQISDPRFSEVVRVYEVKGFDRFPGRVLKTSEIKEIIKTFIKAARIACDSGADMVDIKLCHGYLGGQILRPANTRGDSYGGSLENRLRFVEEVVQGIKEKIPDSKFKVMSRFSIYEGDFTADGEPITGGIGTKGPESTEFSLDEPHQILKKLVDFGVDMLNISASIPSYNSAKWGGVAKPPKDFVADDPNTYRSYHHLDFAKGVKDLNLGVPVIGTGFSIFGKDILKVGEKAISNGYVDMVGIGRQTLADPDVEQILKSEARYCVRCNGCRELLLSQMPIGCTQYDKFYTMIRNSTRLHFTAPWRQKPDDSRKL